MASVFGDFDLDAAAVDVDADDDEDFVADVLVSTTAAVDGFTDDVVDGLDADGFDEPDVDFGAMAPLSGFGVESDEERALKMRTRMLYESGRFFV